MKECKFDGVSPCDEMTPDGVCRKHRSMFGHPSWEYVDMLREELQQFCDVAKLNPIKYPEGRRLPDAELNQDPAFLAMQLGNAEERIDLLEGLLANVHDELHDPMSQYWCDKPKEDRELLEALRDRVDKAMGWDVCERCEGTKRVVDYKATREAIETIEGSGMGGDCFGVNYTEYMPCPNCQREDDAETKTKS